MKIFALQFIVMISLLSPSLLAQPANPESCRRIANQVEASLFRDDLNKWFAVAIDEKKGGFFENFRDDWTPGPTGTKSIVYQSRLTWLSAAAMRYPKDAQRYRDAFVKQWDFISKSQIDATHGGWYPTVSADGSPRQRQGKSDAWTEGYHQGRAMLNVTERLRRMAEGHGS